LERRFGRWRYHGIGWINPEAGLIASFINFGKIRFDAAANEAYNDGLRRLEKKKMHNDGKMK